MNRNNLSQPRYIVVDIRDVLKDYSANRNYHPVYKHFPLSDMVQCILTVNPYEDHGEYFWNELDRRFTEANCEDALDFNVLSLFYELLCTYLDENIRQKLPSHIDSGEFVFHRWVSSTAILMQKDQNAFSGHGLM